MREECRALMAARGPGARLTPGAPPLVTRGHQLHATHVLHVTGPTVRPPGRAPTADERSTLHQCYVGCLEAAVSVRATSIAFCGISTGLFGYPHADAASCALEAVTAWLADRPDCALECVVFNVFTPEAGRAYADATERARQAGAWEGVAVAEMVD